MRIPAVTLILTAAAMIGSGCAARREVAVPILMYHRIDAAMTNEWTVSRDAFEGQLSALRAAGYTSVLPSDLPDIAAGKKPAPAKPIVITFDDGFLSAMTEAEPLLKKYGFRAIDYVITDRVADDEKHRKSFEGAQCLTWPEIRAMRERGTFVFGGHSHTHIALDKSRDAAREISECKRLLVERGGFTSDSFCYPYGTCNDEVVRLVRDNGFTTAMTAFDRIAKIGPRTNLLRLPRLWIRGRELPATLPQVEKTK
jgi:peptidoglycan/xylan/chitin deacetylase (PgdA/CDA1 family)